MKRHCIYNKKTKQKVLISAGELPQGFQLEDPSLGFFEYEGLNSRVQTELVFDGDIPRIVETPIDMTPVRWREIRTKRDELLAKNVDSKKNYMIFGDLAQAEIDAIRAYRIALLNVPQDIEAKIASSEISSVLDVNIETYPWPVLE